MALDQPPAVNAVVVQSARLPPAAGEAAFSVVQISPEVLQTQPRIDEALTQVPGVTLFRRNSSLAANPTTQGVSLRNIAGSGAGRALVTLDGVPQNDPFGGWVIWTGLPSETIEGVRVIKGAGAGPYGAGALTGTIDLQERASLNGGAVGELAAGSLGYRRGAVAVDAPAGPARLMASFTDEHSDGWIPVEPGRRGAADRPLSLDDWSGAFRILADVGPGALALRASTYSEKRGAGTIDTVSKAKGQIYSATYASAPSGDRLGWRVQGWLSTSDLFNSSVSVATNRRTANPANVQFHTPARGYGLNAALRKSAADFTWEVGADVRAAEGESRELFRFVAPDLRMLRTAGGKTLVGGVYAEGSRTVGPWLLTGGVRVDGWRTYDAHRMEQDRATGAVTLTETPSDRDGLVPTARAGVRRDLGEGFALRTAAYAGFRPATLNELHRPFRVGNDVTEANPALKPERLYGVEGGLEWTRGPIAWSGDVFYNKLADAIANVTIGVGPGTFPIAGVIPAGGTLRQRRNAGSVNAYGVESAAHWRFGETVSLDVAGAYTHARIDGGSAAPQLTGLRPAGTPEVSATVGAGWRIAPPVYVRADLHYEGARFDDDLNSRRLKESVTLDARAELRVATRVVLFAAAENLFGAHVVTAMSADRIRSFGPPRLFRAGVTLRD